MSELYISFKAAVFKKDRNTIVSICNNVHAINYSSDNLQCSPMTIWLEALCLIYISFDDETEIQYIQCVEHIKKFLCHKLISSDSLYRGRLIVVLLKCCNELFYHSIELSQEVSQYRQELLTLILEAFFENAYSKTDLANMMNTFTWNATLDILMNGKDDKIYAYIESQRVLVYKLSRLLYLQLVKSKSIEITNANLIASYINLTTRIPSLCSHPLCIDDEWRTEMPEIPLPDPSDVNFDTLFLGIDLP